MKVAWPSVLESFFITLTGLIDTFMVSSLGKEAIAAVGLTNQPKFIGLSFFFSINVAVSALVARRKGEEDKNSANAVLVTAFAIAAVLTAIISFVFVKYSETILRWAGSNSDTHELANEYFRIIMGFVFFNVISMTINAAQRGSGNTQIAFTTNFVSSIVNMTFNYLLIGGNLGFPKLGVKGAAIATVVGTAVASIMSIRSLFKPHSYVDIRYIFARKIKPRVEEAISIAKLGLNMFVENIAMRIGFLATALLAAGLGTAQFAAHNVGMQVLSLGFAFADGMQVAAVSLAGQSLGAGRKEDAKTYGQVCQRIGLAISICLSVILFVFGKHIFKLFFDANAEPEIIEYGVLITRFITVIVILQISQIIYGGCLRAGGDVKYTLMASIVSVSIIRTVVTYVLVNGFHLGLTGIWIGILSDQFSRFIMMSLRFKTGKWVNIKI